ncbi:DUF6444 domain-containing protein [Acidithiobacillus ferriphilus]|uniref:DUF6444 domain-containing protein n=1 Tax=Acidithiobacillus ferriphilus TaxID=1689834 RepID=UPI0038CBFBE8
MELPALNMMNHATNKDDLIRFLLAEEAELKSRIVAIEVCLAKDSYNSSRPPYSDGLCKHIPKSLYRAGQHSKGEQKGSAPERVAASDHEVIHFLPIACDACGNTLDEAYLSEAYQVIFDETSMRAADKFHCLYAAATQTLAWMGIRTGRGQETFDAFGLLTKFQGSTIHNSWTPYRKYECRYVLCNAHHLQGLTLIHELYGQRWTKNMIDLLVPATEKRPSSARTAKTGWSRLTRVIPLCLFESDLTNPLKKRKDSSAHQRQSYPINLLRRLHEHREAALRSSWVWRCPSPIISQNRRYGCLRPT